MIDENKIWVWEDISENVPDQNENIWEKLVNLFGISGEPGFSEKMLNATFPNIFGHQNPVPIRWTIYREETGEMVAAHGCYIGEDEEQHPFLLIVHQDHRRKGLGTMMANFAKDRYADERGKEGDGATVFKDVKATVAGAQFLNKYVNAVYNERNGNV